MVGMKSEGSPSALLVGTQTGAATAENSMEFPQKSKTELPFDPVIPLLGTYPRIPKHQSKNTHLPSRS